MSNSSMDIFEIRLFNLRKLAEDIGRPALAEKIGMSYNLLSNYIGKTPKKNIGEKTARNVEKAFDLPHGWLDQNHSDNSLTVHRDLHQHQWPFENISYEKVKNLSPRDLIRLEAGIEIAAKDLGLDIVEMSNPAKSEVA